MSVDPPRNVSVGAPTLLLVPTELERKRFEDQGGLPPGVALPKTCGFGPVASAARSAQMLSLLRPRRAILFGIAGAYDVARDPVGSARVFSRVAIDGVGVGEGERFVGPPKLGFPQWPGSSDTTDHPVQDELALTTPPGFQAGLLLTTCAASDSPEHAAERLARFPEAVAEDMEGFGVACACALHRVPLTVVRGISNAVGDRDPGAWRIPAALAAARRLLFEVIDALHAVDERTDDATRGRT